MGKPEERAKDWQNSQIEQSGVKSIENTLLKYFNYLTISERLVYSQVSNRMGGRNKWGGGQISAKIINGEGAINREVDKNLQSW